MRRPAVILLVAAVVFLLLLPRLSRRSSELKDGVDSRELQGAFGPDDPSARAISDSALQNHVWVIEMDSVFLRNGVAETSQAPGSASRTVTRYSGIRRAIDLNQDGISDVAFILEQDRGGSGTFSYLLAAINSRTGLSTIPGVFLGDRIAVQEVEAVPDFPGRIRVRYLDRAGDEAMAAEPTLPTERVFQLRDRQLIEVTTHLTPSGSSLDE